MVPCLMVSLYFNFASPCELAYGSQLGPSLSIERDRIMALPKGRLLTLLVSFTHSFELLLLSMDALLQRSGLVFSIAIRSLKSGDRSAKVAYVYQKVDCNSLQLRLLSCCDLLHRSRCLSSCFRQERESPSCYLLLQPNNTIVIIVSMIVHSAASFLVNMH